MGTKLHRTLIQIGVAAAVLGTSLSAAGNVGPDYVTGGPVKLVERIPMAADGVGARVVGHYLYVTSTKDLEIYDITHPTDPQLVGTATVDVEFENEQVPTDGRILGISGQTSTVTTQDAACPPNTSTDSTYKLNCLAIFDVRNPAHPTLVAQVGGAGDHTSTCITVGHNHCAYFYGSSGHITDARTVLANGKARLLQANWINWVDKQTQRKLTECHNQWQIRPGILLTACEPMALLSIRKQEGGSITRPTLLATADYSHAPDDKKRFVHSVLWPRGGTDHIMLSGGETNFTGACSSQSGAFSTFIAHRTWNHHPTFTWADQYRPVSGTYLDGNPPDGTYSFGCSVHWFEANPEFHNGGLVALASYENGTRFLRIDPDGKIHQVGFFEPLGGSTSVPHWAPDKHTVYCVDYHRGLDVIQWTGPTDGITK